MMNKKVTYTLPKAIINTIEKRSFLADVPMSRLVSESIQNGYEMMVDSLYNNDKKPLVGIRRRRNGTIPKTFSMPIKVVDTLRWFSKTLNVRTSHLVTVCVLNSEYGDLEGEQRLVDLIKMADEIG
jgi:hypothetical protein